MPKIAATTAWNSTPPDPPDLCKSQGLETSHLNTSLIPIKKKRPQKQRETRAASRFKTKIRSSQLKEEALG
ncbi:unnamed protein product [Arabidopsis halleri]